MIHVTTGNQLDVVYEYEGDVQVLRGLMKWGSNELIPLPDIGGLIRTLQRVENECRASRFKADERDDTTRVQG